MKFKKLIKRVFRLKPKKKKELSYRDYVNMEEEDKRIMLKERGIYL